MASGIAPLRTPVHAKRSGMSSAGDGGVDAWGALGVPRAPAVGTAVGEAAGLPWRPGPRMPYTSVTTMMTASATAATAAQAK